MQPDAPVEPPLQTPREALNLRTSPENGPFETSVYRIFIPLALEFWTWAERFWRLGRKLSKRKINEESESARVLESRLC